MIATLAAGSAAVFFLLALVLAEVSGDGRGGLTLVGLFLLSVAVTAIAGDRRRR